MRKWSVYSDKTPIRRFVDRELARDCARKTARETMQTCYVAPTADDALIAAQFKRLKRKRERKW